MTEYKALLSDCCMRMGVPLSEQQLEQFMTYLSLLLEWNERMNLTAITECRSEAFRGLPEPDPGDTELGWTAGD